MRKFIIPLLSVLSFISSSNCFAQAVETKPAKIKLHRHIVIDKSLASTEEVMIEVEIFSREIIQNFSSLNFRHQVGTQKVSKLDAYTLKANGRKVPVAADKIITQNVAAAPNTASFTTDILTKTALYSDIEVGDKLILNYKLASNSKTLGDFINFAASFTLNQYHDNVEYKLTYPKSLKLNFDIWGLERKDQEEGDKISVTLKHPIGAEAPSEKLSLDSSTFRPRFYISNAKTFEEIGNVYAKLIEGKNAVTPQITQLAYNITKDLKDDRAKAAALYNWIIQNIHYVTISFGSGRIVPNSTDTILGNRYGDCKDVSVLYVALLKAVKIDAELVLINSSDIYQLSKAPSLSEFNHMIVYLPHFKLYADPTLTSGRLGELPLALFAKDALILGENSSRLMKTPPLKAGENWTKNKITLAVDLDGKVTGNNVMENKGSAAIRHREFSKALKVGNKEEIIKNLVGYHVGLTNVTADFGDATKLQGDMLTASALFTYENKSLEGKSTRITSGLSPFHRPYMSLPDGKKPRQTDFLCLAQGYEEAISIEIPAKYRFTRYPRIVKISNDYFDYTASRTMEDNKMMIVRRYQPKFAQPYCDKSAVEVIKEDVEKMRVSLRSTFTYE